MSIKCGMPLDGPGSTRWCENDAPCAAHAPLIRRISGPPCATGTRSKKEQQDDALLSALLFEARERIAASVAVMPGDAWGQRIIAKIDAYRAARGWDPNGFGGEDGPAVTP